jgi:hypothetical protein
VSPVIDRDRPWLCCPVIRRPPTTPNKPQRHVIDEHGPRMVRNTFEQNHHTSMAKSCPTSGDGTAVSVRPSSRGLHQQRAPDISTNRDTYRPKTTAHQPNSQEAPHAHPN